MEFTMLNNSAVFKDDGTNGNIVPNGNIEMNL